MLKINIHMVVEYMICRLCVWFIKINIWKIAPFMSPTVTFTFLSIQMKLFNFKLADKTDVKLAGTLSVISVVLQNFFLANRICKYKYSCCLTKDSF